MRKKKWKNFPFKSLLVTLFQLELSHSKHLEALSKQLNQNMSKNHP